MEHLSAMCFEGTVHKKPMIYKYVSPGDCVKSPGSVITILHSHWATGVNGHVSWKGLDLQLLDVHSCNMSMWKLGSRPIICINVDCSMQLCCSEGGNTMWACSPIQSSLSSGNCSSGPSGLLSAPQHGSASFHSHPQLLSHFSSPLTFIFSSPLHQLHPLLVLSLLSYNSSPFLWVIPLAQSVICHYPSTLPPVFFSVLCFRHGLSELLTEAQRVDTYCGIYVFASPLFIISHFLPPFFPLRFCVCQYQLVLH